MYNEIPAKYGINSLNQLNYSMNILEPMPTKSPYRTICMALHKSGTWVSITIAGWDHSSFSVPYGCTSNREDKQSTITAMLIRHKIGS